MKKYITLLLVALFSVYYTGCNTVKDYIDNESIIAKSAVQYGVLEYIDDDSDNYDKIVKYSNNLKLYVSNDTQGTLDVLFDKIKSDISESDLKQQEKIITLTIVDVTKDYASKKLEEHNLSLDEYNATALILIKWIQEAAEFSQIGVTSEQVAKNIK